jgi:formate dehydrogenase maturation protein FdhE
VADREWARRIARAEALAAEGGPVASLIRFYACLLREQKKICDALDTTRPTGVLEADIGLVLDRGADLFRTVSEDGPGQLVIDARAFLGSPQSAREDALLTYWRTRSDRSFFPKALLQPYAEWLTRHGSGAIAGSSISAENTCPRCGGAPQLSMFDGSAATTSDGGSRYLQCSTCLARWLCRRVVCPSCGNEDERTLGYYQAPPFSHVRVDACERCGRYLKSIDLTRLGIAVPLVDEVAAAPLDLWAQERGYTKIALNLIGL